MEVFNLVNNSTEERVNLTEQGDDRIPGGLFFRLSQTGVNYVTQMASDALPELLI
uniref:Uncharacterized protein n=1 Tax=Plectus sambesii TaxID=2011161 RepID=A0A914V3Z2_9BILA